MRLSSFKCQEPEPISAPELKDREPELPKERFAPRTTVFFIVDALNIGLPPPPPPPLAVSSSLPVLYKGPLPAIQIESVAAAS